MEPALNSLSDLDLAAFHRDGFIVLRGLAACETCDEMRQVAEEHLLAQLAPVEYEVDVQYPGSPTSHDAVGGHTTRRLLSAYTRHAVFREWATSDVVRDLVEQLFDHDTIQLSQCHHNCVMTKEPGFSSATLWHQDNRFWSFDEQNLISVWLSIGQEARRNGCLRVIPATHDTEFEPGRFDAGLFLRPELPENKDLIAKSVLVELGKGDVLFFHSRLLHAAGRNLTNETKLSLVFTYHEASNRPIEDTRSARFPAISLAD